MLIHTPYDGSSRLFTIGVRPLDPARWLERGPRLAAYLVEKRRLLAERRADVFVARYDTLAAQREAHARIRAFLGASAPAPSGDPSPLADAALMVEDDLVLMRRHDDGWRLVAAAVCFPSTWSLREKFDRTLAQMHVPVPGFAGQMEQRVTRIFDHLAPDAPVERFNWSIYDTGRLHHPVAPATPAFMTPGADIEQTAFIRVERQTLVKLPASGDILFTIRIVADPFAAFREDPRGAALAASLREQILGLTPEQLAYKGMTASRDALAQALERIAAGPKSPP